MGILLAILVFAVAIVVLSGGAKNSNKKFIVRSGTCPTCGSPCKWYIDPDTGSKFFRCYWCNDCSG